MALWQPTHRPRILRAAALAASETPAPGPAQPAPQPAAQGPQERVEPSTPTSAPPTTEAAPGAPCGPSGGAIDPNTGISLWWRRRHSRMRRRRPPRPGKRWPPTLSQFAATRVPLSRPSRRSGALSVSSVNSQIERFGAVEIQSPQGPESTHNGHSSSLARTSAIRSQSGRSIAAISQPPELHRELIELFLIRFAPLHRADTLNSASSRRLDYRDERLPALGRGR